MSAEGLKLYDRFAPIYDACGISSFGVNFGRSMLAYFHDNNLNYRHHLDLCCGTGKLCGLFRDNGFVSEGVDISHEMLKVAREHYPDINFLEEDVSVFCRDNAYDVITCTDDALNHITDPEKLRSTIHNVGCMLRKDGLFIFDVNIFGLLPFEHEYEKSLSENTKLMYYISRQDDLLKFRVRYYEDNRLVWEDTVLEREYFINDLLSMLNENSLVIEQCSQTGFGDARVDKWRIFARKI